MCLFVCLVHYTKPFDEVSARLNAHREYLKEGYEKGFLLASGPRIPKDGGIIIGRFNDMASARRFSENDPFILENLARYEILCFEAVLHKDILDAFLASPLS